MKQNFQRNKQVNKVQQITTQKLPGTLYKDAPV